MLIKIGGIFMKERIILAVDTSEVERAEQLAETARMLGAVSIKMGLELSSATSWRFCSDLAAEYNLEWVADAKLDDIPNTVVGAVRNIKSLPHPPFGITMHTTAGFEAMKRAQEEAETIKMLGVTVLTSLGYDETLAIFRTSPARKVMELAEMAAEANLGGLVASPQEVAQIKSNPRTKQLLAMIPGTRSSKSQTHDQARTTTPAEAIKRGADLLVIGRQITGAENPIQAYNELIAEIENC